ncbi:MAG TPA: nucleotidyltransferase family protein [Thermoanaerobaculia bacterium]
MGELPSVIHAHFDAIRGACEVHHVKSLVLFGSAARDDFDSSRSDLDFLVEFLPDEPHTRFGGEYFALKVDLEDLFGRRVDLVEPTAIENPYLKRSIYESTVPVYVAA